MIFPNSVGRLVHHVVGCGVGIVAMGFSKGEYICLDCSHCMECFIKSYTMWIKYSIDILAVEANDIITVREAWVTPWGRRLCRGSGGMKNGVSWRLNWEGVTYASVVDIVGVEADGGIFQVGACVGDVDFIVAVQSC